MRPLLPFAAIFPFDARAGRCAGGIADDIPGDDIPGDPGAVAAGPVPGYGVSREGLGGRLDSGEEGPGPPGTGWFGPGAPTPGPVRCADTGAAIASAATIATPLMRCFMPLILCCSSGQATKLPNTQKRGPGCCGANGAARHPVPVHRII
jgi:hypothetical protein